jgi:hypothetical protein
MAIAAALIAGLLIGSMSLGGTPAAAQPENSPQMQASARTEQDLGEAPRALSIKDPLAVFAFVLSRIPGAATIYPTENYYYFRFRHRGTVYSGNVRLAAEDRDAGKLHFAYGVAPSARRPAPAVRYQPLDASRGVSIERLEPLRYRVSHAGRSVVFMLNDLSGAKPPPGLLRDHERYLGAVFDESGVRFFLVFNARLNVFHYLLDETQPPADVWGAAGEALVIGKRTGFAFFQDGDRKILIGANARNSRLNTLFDGPFDQLPENFVEGNTLHDAIVAASPAVKDTIDRLGNFKDGVGRFLIHPYLLYRTPADLTVFRRCLADKSVEPAQRALCFVISDAESMKRNPRPLALEKR